MDKENLVTLRTRDLTKPLKRHVVFSCQQIWKQTKWCTGVLSLVCHMNNIQSSTTKPEVPWLTPNSLRIVYTTGSKGPAQSQIYASSGWFLGWMTYMVRGARSNYGICKWATQLVCLVELNGKRFRLNYNSSRSIRLGNLKDTSIFPVLFSIRIIYQHGLRQWLISDQNKINMW